MISIKFLQTQSDFIYNEFGFTESEIADFDRDSLRELREKCFDIEVEEAASADNNNVEVSQRGGIASELVDVLLTLIEDSNSQKTA